MMQGQGPVHLVWLLPVMLSREPPGLAKVPMEDTVWLGPRKGSGSQDRRAEQHLPRVFSSGLVPVAQVVGSGLEAF